MELDVERERIHKAITSLQKSVGARPLGWYCRYGPSLNTRRLLVEEGSFLWTFPTATMTSSIILGEGQRPLHILWCPTR